ncbi:MAG: crossover junction endodeoxyribonuclease RuvC [Solirubrobacteraceae bacterium]
MIVLGIDPGIANTGFGLVSDSGSRLQAVAFGVIETSPAMPLATRLADIHMEVDRLLSAHEVRAVAVEDLYFGANVVSAMAVGQARGVVMLAAAQRSVPVTAYTPQQVKAAVCGSGRADKAQVARMVGRLLGMGSLPRPDHAADALAVALCALNRMPLAGAVARAVG